MPLRDLFKGVAFEPEDLAVMTAAFDDCARRLNIDDCDDPIAELLARHIINSARHGERDPLRLARDGLDGVQPRAS